MDRRGLPLPTSAHTASRRLESPLRCAPVASTSSVFAFIVLGRHSRTFDALFDSMVPDKAQFLGAKAKRLQRRLRWNEVEYKAGIIGVIYNCIVTAQEGAMASFAKRLPIHWR